MEANNKDQYTEKERKDQQEKADQKKANKQDEPHKNHGVPDDPAEERNGGLRGAENFKRNMGCGG